MCYAVLEQKENTVFISAIILNKKTLKITIFAYEFE